MLRNNLGSLRQNYTCMSSCHATAAQLSTLGPGVLHHKVPLQKQISVQYGRIITGLEGISLQKYANGKPKL